MKHRPTDPVIVATLFPEMRSSGVAMLRSLTEEQWRLPTACTGWSVHDVALHILGGLQASISRRRDGHPGNFSDFAPSLDGPDDDKSFVATLNAWNEAWVLASRRISPALTTDLINGAGRRFEDYIRKLDVMQMGGPVGWAGPDPAPVWLDIAREYTEVWTHLAQIREATGRNLVDAPRFFSPVVWTFAHGIPHALRGDHRPPGTVLRIIVYGDVGGEWCVGREGDRWRILPTTPADVNASVAVDAVVLWRLATKGIDPSAVRPLMDINGDQELGEGILNLVAILA